MMIILARQWYEIDWSHFEFFEMCMIPSNVIYVLHSSWVNENIKENCVVIFIYLGNGSSGRCFIVCVDWICNKSEAFYDQKTIPIELLSSSIGQTIEWFELLLNFNHIAQQCI